jgi:RNA polymerase sigma-70 factor (ECF subfamily)
MLGATMEKSPGDLDAELVAAARGGHDDAFAALIKRHERKVFAMASRFFERREDVEEAAQDTFLRAWSHLGSWRSDAPFEHWLTRICLNCCYRRLSRTPKTTELVEADLGSHHHDPTVALEVRTLLRGLDPRDRFLLVLLEVEGWTTAEIAEKLGWSRTNVKVRAFRARRQLRARLEEVPR